MSANAMCEHLSASGISERRVDDEDKVWHCDMCGFLYVDIRRSPTLVRRFGIEERLENLRIENDRLRAVLSTYDEAEVLAVLLANPATDPPNTET